MNINTKNNFNNSVNFNGLNRTLSKNIYYYKNVQKLSEIYPKSNNIVGNIPHQWLKNMPKENRGEQVQNLYKKLGIFMRYILPVMGGNVLSSKILTSILKKSQAISKDSSISIKYAGMGANANGYELRNTKENYSLFVKKYRIYIPNGIKLLNHGAEAENNIKTYLKNRLKTNEEKKHFSKFYFGDIKNKYYIEEFINEKYNTDEFPQDKLKVLREPIYKILSKKSMVHDDFHDGNIKIKKDKNNNYYAVLFDLGEVYEMK